MKSNQLQKYIIPGVLFVLLVLFTILSFFSNQQKKVYRSRAEYIVPTDSIQPTQPSLEQCAYPNARLCSDDGCSNCNRCSDGSYQCLSFVQPTTVLPTSPVQPTVYVSSCYYQTATSCNRDCVGVCQSCSSGGYQCMAVEPTTCVLCLTANPTPTTNPGHCNPGERSSTNERGVADCIVCSSAGKWVAVNAATCGKNGPITDADIVINAQDTYVKYELRQKGYDMALNSSDYNGTEKGLLVFMKTSDSVSQGWNTLSAAFSQASYAVTGGLLGDQNPKITNTFEGYLTANLNANTVNPSRQKCGNVGTLVNAVTGNFAEIASEGCSGQAAQSVVTGVAGGIQKVPFVGSLLSPVSDGILSVTYGGNENEIKAAKSAIKFGSEVVDIADTTYGFGKSGAKLAADKLQTTAFNRIEDGATDALTVRAGEAGNFLADKLNNLEKMNGLTQKTNALLRDTKADALANIPGGSTLYKTVTRVDNTVSQAVQTTIVKIENNQTVKQIVNSPVGQFVDKGVDVIKPISQSKVGSYVIEKIIKEPIQQKEKELIGEQNYKWYRVIKGLLDFTGKKVKSNE